VLQPCCCCCCCCCCGAVIGLRALPSLPSFSTDHILEHRPGWGELYDILGLEPASLAQLLQALLLPYLTDLTPPDRLAALEFIKGHWSTGKQYSGPLSTTAAFTTAMQEIAFLPAALPVTGSQGDSADEAEGQRQLYRPAQLFDPSVPLFAAVMAVMAGAHGSIAAAGAQVLFPAAPYNSDDWLRMLRDLGLQHKVTKDTFMQLAQHVAREAAGLAAPGTAAGAAASAGACVDVTGADPHQLQRVEAAADALLAHLRSHWTGLGQDRDFWQAVARVQFWPATLGVPGAWSLAEQLDHSGGKGVDLNAAEARQKHTEEGGITSLNLVLDYRHSRLEALVLADWQIALLCSRFAKKLT